MTSMRLQFAPNDTEEEEGLSEAGIETFKGDPISSVARETAQNSRDAWREFPVKVEFDLVRIAAREFPDLEEFKAHIGACNERAQKGKDLKTKQFFAKAMSLLSQGTFYGLRISDEGTTGLIGPCVSGTPFHSLVKSSGVSNKNDPTSGGSYGIGKNATFAISDLHTVFYATRYEDGDSSPYLAQGKCKLTSHSLREKELRATGYWGNAGYKPIENENNAPAWLKREQIGTTSVSVGFPVTEGWQYKISESLVRNFFAAIQRGQLEFSVDERAIHINGSSLAGLFESTEVMAAAEAQSTTDELQFSKQLYRCLISAEVGIHDHSHPLIGSYRLRLLVGEGLPQRVAIIRNGMLITSQLQHFKDKLTSFPMYKDFVAILEPVDEGASTLIKRLENPQHNELSVDRLIDESEKKTVRAGMNALIKWVRDSIRAEAYTRPADEVSLDEMNEFFGDVTNADRIPAPGDDTNPMALTYTPIKVRPQARSEGESGEEDDGGGGQNESQGGNAPGEGGGVGGGTGGSGGGESFVFEDFRNILSPVHPDVERTLFFTPLESGAARIAIHAKGMQADVALTGSTFLDADGNPVKIIELQKGERTRLTVRFSTTFLGPIDMRLYKTAEVKHEAA